MNQRVVTHVGVKELLVDWFGVGARVTDWSVGNEKRLAISWGRPVDYYSEHALLVSVIGEAVVLAEVTGFYRLVWEMELSAPDLGQLRSVIEAECSYFK